MGAISVLLERKQQSDCKKKKEGTTIETLNVRSPHARGKVQELIYKLKRYRWDILGFAEVKWTGFGKTTTDGGRKIWCCGEDSKHQYGLAFIVWKGVVGSIISCTPISSKLISIRSSAGPHNITVIQVYAPTSHHEDEKVEQFYEQLDSVIAKAPKKDILVVQCDWNAKVGRHAYQHWAGTVGRFGIGQTNDRGWKLSEFADSHRCTLAKTLYPYRLSRTATWHASHGQIHNQVDLILTPQPFKSSIKKANARSFPGTDIGSDHDLVFTTIKLKLKTKCFTQSPRIRFDLEKLKDPKTAEVFQANVGGKFAALRVLDSDVDTLANSIKEGLLSTAK